MSIIFIEGWEASSLDGWTVVNGAPAVDSSAGLDMSGAYCLDMTGLDARLRKILSASHSSLYFAFRWRPSESACDCFVNFWDSAGTQIATVSRNVTSGKMEIHLGAYTGTLWDTGDTVFTDYARTYLIEVFYDPKNSGGSLVVKVDGTEEVNSGSVDTTAGLENVQAFQFGRNNTGNHSGCHIDDVVVCDDDWTGNTKIQAQFPTGAGATTGLTPSTGSNYACVDEKPYSDADYVYGNTADLVDTYATSDLAESVTAIKCIQVSARMAYAGTPTPTKQDIVIRPASTDRPSGTTISPGIAFARYDRIWELNPEDSAAFEAADLNGMEIGIKLVA